MSARSQRAQHKPERAAPALNEQRLIGCVRRFPLLYDTSHPEYLVYGRKADAWNEIADILGFSAYKCKSRWNSMRDGYRKSLRKNKLRVLNGEPPVYYKHAKRLEFLRQFLRANGDIEDEDITDVLVTKLEADDLNADIASVGDSKEDLGESQAKRWRGKVAPDSPEPSLDYYSEDMHELASTSMHLARTEHPVDAFLGCIGAMVKALPPYYQAMAKAEIFATAHKYEVLCIKGTPQQSRDSGGEPLVSGTTSEPEAPAVSIKKDPGDIDIEDNTPAED